jgi:Golgi nucleoside diphosphatase
VISGEEEAIYGWTAVNFVKETLLKYSEGSGSVLDPDLTYGMLEMGGASTQIAYFEPSGDVMANLFKLQIGAAKHWNVYAHSFLYFGVNGGYDRLNARLVKTAELDGVDPALGVHNPCLPGDGHYIFTSRVHMMDDGNFMPLSSPNDQSILQAQLTTTLMKNDEPRGNYTQCYEEVYKLFQKETNNWCNFAHGTCRAR